MLTSTLFALIALATSMPALAAPTHMRRGDSDESSALEARRCYAIGRKDLSARCDYTNVGLLRPNPKIFGLRDVDTSADSGAFSLEDAAHVASIGSSLVNIGESIFGGTKKQRDESGALALKVCPIVARAGISLSGCPTEPLAKPLFGLPQVYKRAEDQSSGAFSLEDAAHVASIGSSIVSIGEDIFGGKKKQRDESGALAFKVCPIVARAGISLSACPTEPLVKPLFGLPQVYKRTEDQSSGAFSLEDAAHVASIGSNLVSIGEDIFGKKKTSRELEVARDDNSEAISLGTIGTIVSVAAPVIGGIINHFTNKQQRDYFMEELLARSILDELD